jgi:hypothetical protein
VAHGLFKQERARLGAIERRRIEAERAEPTSQQREAFELIGTPIPLSLP